MMEPKKKIIKDLDFTLMGADRYKYTCRITKHGTFIAHLRPSHWMSQPDSAAVWLCWGKAPSKPSLCP